EALAKPGRDPRDDLPKPLLRQDVLKMEDLREGMVLAGTVRNVVDFGAFVDIGVKQDGLVHISQLADRYIKNPFEVVKVGDVVKVKVMSVDVQRGRVGLSMKEV
ncbi:MAG: S1 RNA-binding domain-containing protein, partial [Anaerolineae bacterium]|nr:S1 RNA-binding domain-containing protein [Anaerolineae bacterium]